MGIKKDRIIIICEEQVGGSIRKQAEMVMKSAAMVSTDSFLFVQSTNLNSAVCKEKNLSVRLMCHYD